MNLSEPFIKRPVMTTIVMVTILLVGILSFFKLPVTDLPNVEYPILTVEASYSGASPDVMARVVTTPLEKELVSLTGIKKIMSHTSRGFTHLFLQFELSHDLNEAVQDVQVALKRAEAHLPKDMDQSPTFHKANAHGESIIYLWLTSPYATTSELYEAAHTRLEQRIARMENVGKVNVYGSPYAVRIHLNPELMAARGITFEEVRNAIGQETGILPLGILDTPGRKFTLEIPGQYKNAENFRNLHLQSQIRLKDIAEVYDGLEREDDIFRKFTKDEGNIAVVLGIQKQNGANTVKISQDLKKLLPELQKELPSTMHLEIWFDKAVWIKEAIEDVEWSLVLAFALVIGVIYFSLKRVKETLIAATALPLSVIGTFIIMQFLNYNIDILSLLALTLAMGFVIDDAIVVLENIVRHQEKGLSAMDASLKGSQQISFTVLSMTISLIAVFIPLLFMQDVTGRLFREFSMTLAIAILVSGFISISLTPMLCSKFLTTHHKKTVAKKNRFSSFHERALDFCLRNKKTTLAIAVTSVTLTVILFRFLPVNLFPEEDRGFIIGYLQMPSGMAKADSEKYQEKLANVAKENEYIQSFATLNFKEYHILLMTLESENRPSQNKVISDLQAKFNAIPGTQIYLKGIQLIDIPGGDRALNNYQYVLRGIDMDEVQKSAEALQKKLLDDQTFVSPMLSFRLDDPKLEITIFENQAEKLGITRQSIQSLLQTAYAGGSIGKIEKGSERYKVFLELAPEFQKNTQALDKLYVKSPSGTPVPLKAVSSWKETVGLQSVQHVDLLPSAAVFFDIAKDKSIDESLAHFNKIANQTLSSSVTGKLEGVAEMVESTTNDTVILLLFAVLAMYVVLGILYESFIHPLTILSSLPFACLGGILTLLAFREPLSLYSMVGFLLLIGIVKKNGIMMVDYALEQQRNENKSALEAIREACLVRFRPIMMTTVAAVMGSLPIAIGIGAGAEVRRGLGLVIVGGLIFSQFLTLYVTPIFYLYLDKLRKKKKPIQTTPETIIS